MNTNILLRSIILLMGLFFSINLNADELFNGIYYKINNEDMTASVSGYDHDLVDLVIADEIVYDNKVYKVTSIEGIKYYYYEDPYKKDYAYGPFMTEGGYWHRKLNTLVIGNNITSIPEKTFLDCTGLTSIKIGNSVATIGPKAFSGCTGLTTITIPNSVTSIEYSAFAGCTGLTSVTIPNGVTGIGKDAFLECIALTAVNIPNSVNAISDNTFSGCSSLKSLSIGTGVVSIGKCSFRNCTSLKTLTLPINLTSIDSTSFKGCIGLESIKVNYGNSIYDSRENCNAIIETSTNILRLGCKNTVIPNTVLEIGDFAFRDYVLPSLYVTENIKRIGKGNSAIKVINISSNSSVDVFVSCYKRIKSYDLSNLNSLFEVDGVVYVPVNPSERKCVIIDNKNFNSTGCYDIGLVTYKGITFSIIEIDDYAFYRNSIRRVKLNFKGTIGRNAFSECDALEEIEINGITSLGSWPAGQSHFGEFYGCDALVSVKVGDGVTSIGGFSNCKNLKQINLSNSVTKIDDYAFSDCPSLQSINMGSGVTRIGIGAFSNCSSLQNIQMGNVETIDKYAFSNCTVLSTIVIPPTVKEIYESAFNNCENLRNVIIESPTANNNGSLLFKYMYDDEWFDNCPLDSVYIGRNIGGTGNSPFSNTPIRTLLISGNVNFGYKANLNGAFRFCKNLKTVKIEEGATEIGYRAFYDCGGLKFVTIGSSIISIGKEAFSGCVGLTSLICDAATPPVCNYNALTDINKWNCKLYVPTNSIAQYQTADQWKDFFLIDSIENIPADVQHVQEQQTSVQANEGVISISGIESEAQRVTVYLSDGRIMGMSSIVNGSAKVKTNINKGSLVIVRIGKKVFKTLMQ